MFLKLLYRLCLIGASIGVLLFALTLAAGMISILLIMVEWVELAVFRPYWVPGVGVLVGGLAFAFLSAFAADMVKSRLSPPAVS